jgi:hypothetical protein
VGNKGQEVFIGMKKRKAVLYTESGNNHISRFPNCDTAFSKRTVVVRAPYRQIFAQEIEDGQGE